MKGHDVSAGLPSRRTFLGWATAFLSAAAVPGAVALGQRPAAAAPTATVAPTGTRGSSPYLMSTWLSLIDRSVEATSTSTSTTALKVQAVTEFSTRHGLATTGQAFLVDFDVAEPLPGGTYTIRGPSLAPVQLYLCGTTANRALINTCTPAR